MMAQKLIKNIFLTIKQSWTDFEDAIIKGFPDELEQGGIPLLKFLAYVLRVNYGKNLTAFDCLHVLIQYWPFQFNDK